MSRGLHFSSEASFAEISFQKVQKLGVIDRLGQVIAAAAFVTLLHVLLFSAGRQKDHRDPAGFFVLLEHTARFESGHAGHHDVHKNQIRFLGMGALDGVLAVYCAQQHVIGFLAEDQPRHQPRGAGVILQEVRSQSAVPGRACHEQIRSPVIKHATTRANRENLLEGSKGDPAKTDASLFIPRKLDNRLTRPGIVMSTGAAFGSP